MESKTPKQTADDIFKQLEEKIFNGIHSRDINVSEHIAIRNIAKSCTLILTEQLIEYLPSVDDIAPPSMAKKTEFVPECWEYWAQVENEVDRI